MKSSPSVAPCGAHVHVPRARQAPQTVVEPTLGIAAGQAVWRAMFDEVSEGRLLAPQLASTLGRLALLALAFAAALALGWFGSTGPGPDAAAAFPLAALAVASVALALLLAQFAFVGHDAGHGAIARRPAVNRALGQFAMTLVTGLAFDEWIARHRAHHRHCQDEARDPDMAVDCVVSLTDASRHRKGRIGRWLTRRQAWLVWPAALLFGHSQRLLSQAAVLAHPHRHLLDAAALVAHFALWFGVPCLLLGVPPAQAVLVYLLPLTLLGPYLAAIFWVNHIGMPLVARTDAFSFLEHQAVTSRTITAAPIWHWVFGGLNFQVEHHLFPKVPSRRLAALQPIVQRHLQSHRVPYHAVSWPTALRAVGTHLRDVARAA
jgi:fatty acid desaturase